MKNQLQFYKENHENELSRKNQIDTSIGFPTTLLTLLIAGGFYLFQNENFNSIGNDYIQIIIFITGILFPISIVTAIIFLSRMFLNRFQKYEYLPCSRDLINREKELYDHYYKFFKEEDTKNPKKMALKYADREFRNDLMNYYVEFATCNQLINDGRIKDFYISRKLLIISIILLFINGLLILI